MNDTEFLQGLICVIKNHKKFSDEDITLLKEIKQIINEKWITIHPHGDDSDDYRRIKLEDGERPKEAIDRVYKKEGKNENKENLRKKQKQLYQDILKAKKRGDKEKHKELLKKYNDIEDKLKNQNNTSKENNNPKVKLAGVEAGKPMSREKADNNSPNPNYGKSRGYTTNCQTCVVAYEARLRGYDVQALGNYKNPTIKSLSTKTNIAWIDPKTGEHPKYIQDVSVKNSKTCYAWLDREIKQGNRYTLQWAWKGRSRTGHIVSIDRDNNNNLRLYDPQNGKTTIDKTELLRYFGRFKYQMSTYGLKFPTPPKVLRVDNMDFNTDIVDKILEKSN